MNENGKISSVEEIDKEFVKSNVKKCGFTVRKQRLHGMTTKYRNGRGGEDVLRCENCK